MELKIKGFDLLKVGQKRYYFKLKNGKRKIAYEILKFNEKEIEFMTNGVMFLGENEDIKLKKDIISLNDIEEIIEK